MKETVIIFPVPTCLNVRTKQNVFTFLMFAIKRKTLFGDDDLSCSYDNIFVCPVECTCFAQGFICHNVGSQVITQIWKTAKYLKCYSCNFQSHKFFVSSSDSLLFLSLKRFQYFYICPNENKKLSSLKQLDMSLNKLTIMQGLSIPFACVGSGDPVRVLRLYTTNTLDIFWSIYFWGICTTCHYRSNVLRSSLTLWDFLLLLWWCHSECWPCTVRCLIYHLCRC